MKKKYFDARDRENITEKRYAIKEMNTDEFKGIISLLSIDGVSKPETWSFGGRDFTIYDKGMEWFRMMPEKGNYNSTAIIGEDGQIVIWYIDIIKEYAYDGEGMLYFNDLYLDIVAFPDGTVKVKDMDDLQKALTSGEIDAEVFRLAVNVKDELMNGILKDINAFKEFTLKLRKEFDYRA